MSNTCSAPIEAKRAYATKLAPQLVKDHGKKKTYSKREIDDSILGAGLGIDWACWGYVLFLDAPTFDAIHQTAGESCDYVSMHTEMGGYLAEAARSGGWFDAGFDWSLFDISDWEWPDLSDWFSIDPN